jgi:hypothetical protein
MSAMTMSVSNTAPVMLTGEAMRAVEGTLHLRR